jgi:hypothetical protein
VREYQSSQKEKFYSYASYCWNGIFGTIGSDKSLFQKICEVEKTTFNCEILVVSRNGNAFGIWIQNRMIAHAYVSHLSHISAFRKTVIDKEKHEQDIFDMAGSGFESTRASC